MAVLDETWLKKQGVEAPATMLTKLADQLASTLELRVGMRLMDLLSEAQMTEFEAVLDNAKTGDEGIEWLDKNYPAYPDIVKAEQVKLSRQVRNATDKVAFIKSLDN